MLFRMEREERVAVGTCKFRQEDIKRKRCWTCKRKRVEAAIDGVSEYMLMLASGQRQTVVSQFFQLDRLVVEGQKTVSVSSCLFTPLISSSSLCLDPDRLRICIPSSR